MNNPNQQSLGQRLLRPEVAQQNPELQQVRETLIQCIDRIDQARQRTSDSQTRWEANQAVSHIQAAYDSAEKFFTVIQTVPQMDSNRAFSQQPQYAPQNQ